MGEVTNMDSMFYGCEALENIDTSKIVMDHVINNDYMYGQCIKLKDKVDYNVYEMKDNEAYTVIRCKYANLYSKPYDSSEVITQIPAGTQVKVTYDYNNDYGGYRKVTYNDQTGYIEGYYLMDDD